GRCLTDNTLLREMTLRHFRLPSGSVVIKKTWLPIRAYVIAFETSNSLSSAHRLGQALANSARRIRGGHLHGVYAGGAGFAAMRAIDPRTAQPGDWYHTFATDKHAILAFKAGMLRG